MNYFLLNTNRRLDPTGTDEQVMLSGRFASAFRDNKKVIEKMKHGDMVFLYRAGDGIIAYGVINSDLRIRDYKGSKDGEYFRTMKAFHILNKPIGATEIRKLARGKIAFLRTLIPISPFLGKKIISLLDEEIFFADAA